MPKKKSRNRRRGNPRNVQTENIPTGANNGQHNTPRTQKAITLALRDVAPLCTPSPRLMRSDSTSLTSITPPNIEGKLVISTSGQSTPKKVPRNNELNATNLQLLFDDGYQERRSYIDNLTPKTPESYLNNLARISSTSTLHRRCLKDRSLCKARPNTSVSNQRSPGSDRMPIRVDVGTQTVYYRPVHAVDAPDATEIYLQSCINIFETPKMNQAALLEQTLERLNTPTCGLDSNLNKISDLNVLPNSHKVHKGFSYCNKLKHLQTFNEILLGGEHMSPKVPHVEPKNNISDGEMSFFSSRLYEFKSASTPIKSVNKNERLIESIAKNIINSKQNTNISEQGLYGGTTPKTPNFNNLNYKCEDKVWTQKIKRNECCSVSKKRYHKSTSPKCARIASPKFQNKIQNVSQHRNRSASVRNDVNIVPKTFSPVRPTNAERSDNFLNFSGRNFYGRFTFRAKRFHSRYSSKWTASIVELCAWLGLTLKRSLTSLYNRVTKEQSLPLDVSAATDDKVPTDGDDFKRQMAALNTKMDLLLCELNRINREQINVLAQDMKDVKKWMLEMEDQIKKKTVVAPPPPTVLPPPPPPLPPPQKALFGTVAPAARPARNAGRKSDENARPAISLDEILRVKLRKTTTKPTLKRGLTQPSISMDMLRQVKLRPSSCSQTPTSLKDVSSDAATLVQSPAKGLTKILSNVDLNVRTVKRLHRNSRFNYNDCRRHLLRREWSGDDDL